MKKSVCFAQQAQAGVLRFGGTTSSGDAAYNGLGWVLSLTYTANNAGPSANITAAVLTIGNSNYLLNTGGTFSDTLTVTQVSGANNDTIVFAMDFVGTPSFGSAAFILSALTLNGKTDVSAIASDANIAALAAINNTLTGGSLVVVPGPNTALITLNGAIPAPEPGSVALLSGLAIVVGRRLLKRRATAAI